MSGKMALNKGKRGEREIINMLQPIVDTVYSNFPDVTEVPLLQRNTLQSDRGGFDIVGLDWMAAEVKFQETLNLNTWWKQTEAQVKEGQIPVLFYRQSRKAWRVQTTMFMPLGDKRFYSRADISIESFLIYFKFRILDELAKLSEI